MKTLANLGEDAVVAALLRGLPQRADVRVGPGDDCAVIGGARDRWWRLLKTDAVIEGVHFLPEEKPARVGWKALCRTVSDVVAMGGLPEHALVTLALRPETPMDWVKKLYEGLRRAARKFGVAIVGGETSRSPGAQMVSVALSGSVERPHCVLRRGGRPADILLVTGRLGGSRAGKHLDFTPRLAEARWLVENFRPHAMMDLSDGLASDLPRLARASGCGFMLEEEKIPRTPGCTLAQALGDGEDFELLFAMAPRQVPSLLAAWKKAFPRLPLTPIGRLTAARAGRTSISHGYDHFA